ncbi:MAG: N-acetylmuramoyl-L-alanine amidase [Planctomycetota bacterium]
MRRLLALATPAALALVGCAAPGPKIGPPPDPFLATRPPRQVTALPPPPPRVQAPQGRPGLPTATPLRGRTIVIDPGHGGKDPGARGRSRIPEKTINLEIGRELAARLRSLGARVYMTRDADQFIELEDRAALADRVRCDLFISIHADSSPRASASGLTAYIARGTGGQSLRAADSIGAALRGAGLEFRGVRGAGFKVLLHSRPAILMECGYLTNGAEAARLATNGHRTQIAAAIADGLAVHFGGVAAGR